ncbi:DAPK1 [Cordylochernes scorpioides]|uniref:DAPK1 n=1 Tax=Cordylochernes scorpioides TaxID=51811 RepID=A0ABY6KJ14_9ARAC|nr:DAPK1 [Cordylochernes scorpioides]
MPDQWRVQNGCTGLHLALRRHHIAVAQLLLTVGCPHDVVDKSGFPPLYLAAQHGHVEVVRYLCLAGCRVEQKSKASEVFTDHMWLWQDEGKEAYAPQLAPSNQPPARVKLKVLGPSGGGKSTLLDSLKCGGYFTGWFRRSKSPSSSSVTGQRLGTAHSSKSSIDMSSDDGLSLSFDSHAFTRGIDMQQVHLSVSTHTSVLTSAWAGVGEVALWEFSGHEAYRVAYTTFLHDPCLHLVVVSLLDPRELQAHQAAQWLELLQAALHCVGPLGRGGRSQKRAHVALVATHADEAESWDLLEAVRALCGDLPGLELHDTVFTVDARQATALKPLKQYLAGVRTALLQISVFKHVNQCVSLYESCGVQDVPRSSPFLDAVITNLATWRRGAHNFPVVSYGQFAELVRNQVNPLAGDQHLSQLVISLQILGEVMLALKCH